MTRLWTSLAGPRWPQLPFGGLRLQRSQPPDGEESEGESPPFGVPPSEEGRSGNLGPPPPDLLRDLTGSGGEDRPPPFEMSDARQPPGRRWWPKILVVFVSILVFFILLNIAVGLFVDRLWFDEVGYRGVFNTRIGTQVWLFFAAFGIAFVFIFLNVVLAWRLPLETRGTETSPFRELSVDTVRRGALWGGFAASLFLGIIFASVAVGHWEELLQFIHSEPFGVRDPEFDKDVGFYVFQLEPLQFIKGWATGVTILALISSVGVYGFRYALHNGDADASRQARMHIALLVVAVIGMFIWGYWLARFELAVSENGVVFGATYTDVNARSVALIIMMMVGGLTAAAFLSWPFHRRLRYPGGAMALLIVASIGGTAIYPAIVQRLQVDPNELDREREFIGRNIEATRFAFALDGIDEREFPAESEATIDDIEANPEVLRNVRLWDHRPLRDTLNNIQTLRQLYVFPDVDVDRYEINGETRQVFLAVRELSQANLRQDQQGWVNRRLQFTHGFGVTVTPVDEVSVSGRPNFFVSNIPPELTALDPETSEIIEISQPRVYFGEVTDPYVIVDSKSEEFDFPIGTGGESTNRYDGSGGIPLGSIFKRAVFALEFQDFNILVSGSVNSDSKIVFRRNIQDRVHELAPFLQLDEDPYIVVGGDGGLYWIQDAYTSTDRFPYSQPLTGGTIGIPAGSNYVRNSVKAVIDAFNGTVDLYIVDETDPIIQVWQKIFPDLFQPQTAFPADLRPHWRYPQDLFTAQAETYLTYHITSPRTLFNREDVWSIPTELLREASVAVEPYYVTLRLPDEPEPEFLLIQPFTPRNRLNAIAWLSGRSDGENYGKLFALRFPASPLVDGPAQIEARIDSDVAVSRQFTLLDQQGSDLIRGNLLFLPVGDSYVYVESIFIQAETATFPLLQAVVVVNGNRIALEETLEEASRVALGLADSTGLTGTILGDDTPAAEDPSDEDGTPSADEPDAADEAPEEDVDDAPVIDPGDTNIAELVEIARDAFSEAQRLFALSEFAEYGKQLELLEDALRRLEAALNAQ